MTAGGSKFVQEIAAYEKQIPSFPSPSCAHFSAAAHSPKTKPDQSHRQSKPPERGWQYKRQYDDQP
jgi:hypothetical protein